MKKILLLIICLFFVSCSTKNNTQEALKNEFLAYTTKFEFIENDQRYLAILSYLNPVFAEFRNKNEDETLVLISYPKEIELDAQTFSINSQNSDIFVQKLDENDPFLDKLTFKVPWANYYKITSSKVVDDLIALAYKTPSGFEVKFTIRKNPKSLYWNPKLKLDD